MTNIKNRLEKLKIASTVDSEYAHNTFKRLTVKLLAAKYGYYIEFNSFMTDYEYDIEEKFWYLVGREIGKLEEGEETPCIDFEYNHPLANEAIEYYKEIMKIK